MGCGVSKNLSGLEPLRVHYPKTLSALELQQYSKQLASLFLAYDSSGRMQLSYQDFRSFCKVPDHTITKRLFKLCDMDGDEHLDFREASFAVWHLCTLDHENLPHLLFDIYDFYYTEKIEHDDVERMLSDSYGYKNITKEEMQEMIERVRERPEGLDRPNFLQFCKRCPLVLKGIVDVQLSMRTAVLGSRVWADLERRRMIKTDAMFRAEKWAMLMERIIVMDIDARIEEEKAHAAREKALGRRIKRVGYASAKNKISQEEEVEAPHYEP
jgi:Ca2+-binding EF-hand superfamily protein